MILHFHLYINVDIDELFHVIVLQIVDSNKLIGDCRNDVIVNS